MKKNDEIKQNLERLFIENYKHVRDESLENIIKDYIIETDLYYKSMGITNYLQDEEVLLLNKVSKNKRLQKAFDEVIKIDFNEAIIKDDLISGIKNAIIDLKQNAQSQQDKFNIQLIFIIHDQLLSAGLYCYGEGSFPILKEPSGFSFDYKKSIYNHIDLINYSTISSKLFSFDLLLEEMEIDNFIMETAFYEHLTECYKYKTYQLLNKAFESINIQEFEKLSIKFPLHIYANEHDCPPINIYLYE
ncbi:hypothetical protein [Flavobacterium sp. DG2-3]|uniref:hypothetical protein n=1 Tax=Flavobacterium sp. DG2-3 TaxID=3068317 RepID=UPI00273DF526|nr:hypothetical protein [Flavobacterium sp. DG2-3]MDP5201332.1 hypothetical protein [Flavobacterium sp. DG2-3]